MFFFYHAENLLAKGTFSFLIHHTVSTVTIFSQKTKIADHLLDFFLKNVVVAGKLIFFDFLDFPFPVFM